MTKGFKKRTGALVTAVTLFLTMMPTVAFATDDTIYTDMTYKGISDGSSNRPYAKFEDALQKANDGDTIVIKGKAFVNALDEGGVNPLVIDKDVKIAGGNNARGELYVRAAGIVLDADVVMQNVELNLANKYHNAIFVNGHQFTANNVTRGSGSREVHLLGGSIGKGTNVTAQMPMPGDTAVMTLEGCEFGNIYAGGMSSSFDGRTTLAIRNCDLGSVYGSGAKETVPTGGWFDISEPAAPPADEAYRTAGSVTIETDDSVSKLNGRGAQEVSLTISDAAGHRPMELTGVQNLAVTSGTASIAVLDNDAVLTMSAGAALDVSKLAGTGTDHTATIASLQGAGKIILQKEQKLNIAGAFAGQYTFETANGFNKRSGIALYDHIYIAADRNDATVLFEPHPMQPTMALSKEGNAWKTSALAEAPSTVNSFTFKENQKKMNVEEFNDIHNGGCSAALDWESSEPGSDLATLTTIPFRYKVSCFGKEYEATATKENDFDVWINIDENHRLWLAATDPDPGVDDSCNAILISGNLAAGIYQISVFAPCADGSEIRQDFTLILTEDTAADDTAIKLTVQDKKFGEKYLPEAAVTDGAVPVTTGDVEFWLNGELLGSAAVDTAGTARLNEQSVLMKNGFIAGSNELRAVYTGSDAHKPAVAIEMFQVNKADDAVITGYTPAADSVFDGTVHLANLHEPTVTVQNEVLNNAPQVVIEYTMNGAVVKEPVFPGTYVVKLKTDESDMYSKIVQSGGSFTIGKRKPDVEVSAVDTGNGEIRLTATVNGIMPYIPTGKITFTWSDQTYDAILSGGTAVHQISGAEAKTYTYKAEYIPAADDSYYAASSSAEETIVPAVGTNVTVTFNVKANGGLFDNGSQEDNVLSGAVSSSLKLPAVKERDGFTFNGWWTEPAGGVKISDPAVFPAANVVYYAQWIEENKLKVSFDPGSGKWQDGTAEVKNVSVSSGESVNIPGTVTREEYQFVGWKIDGTGRAYTAEEIKAMRLTADTRFVAEYKSKTTGGSAGGSGGSAGGGAASSFVIKASAENGGSISPSGNVNVSQGSERTFTITPKDGYKIADVMVDGKSVGPLTVYKFSNVRTAHTITAVFAEIAKEDAALSSLLNTKDHIAFMEGYDNGDFRPDNAVTRAQAAQIFYNLLLNKNVETNISFDDVSSDAWYSTAVEALASLGVIKGADQERFAPGRAISRAEFAAIATRFVSGAQQGSIQFTDVPKDAWYYSNVLTAVQYGWINGYEDNTFRPNRPITRAEAAKIVNHMLGRSADMKYKDTASQIRYFTDVTRDYWAYDEIIEATNSHEYRVVNNVEEWLNLK